VQVGEIVWVDEAIRWLSYFVNSSFFVGCVSGVGGVGDAGNCCWVSRWCGECDKIWRISWVVRSWMLLSRFDPRKNYKDERRPLLS